MAKANPRGAGPEGYTIGEVLNQLKEDFEDITISKIRFLESEGLIYPDRTESGYRIFGDDDVDRLRFILTAQRDHYLPLKVIREQLDRLDAGDTPSTGAAIGPAPPVAPAPVTEQPAGSPALATHQIAAAVEAAMTAGEEPVLDSSHTPVALQLHDFCDAVGMEPGKVRELRAFGIIGDASDESVPFDADDLLAARAAKELLQLGLEPRHLRMYRQFVDREIALFEQLATPLLRQRNPEARRQAARQLEKLASLTGRMKRALLSSALRSYVHNA